MIPSALISLGSLAVASAFPALDFRSIVPLIERQASEVPPYVLTYGKQDNDLRIRVWILTTASSCRLVVFRRNLLSR